MKLLRLKNVYGTLTILFFLMVLPVCPVQAAMKFISPAVCPATLPPGDVGISYTFTFAVSGGGGSPNFQITSGSLPSGLTLSSAGVLSGTPGIGSQGTYTFTVRATKGTGGETLSCSSTLVINTPSCSFVGSSSGAIAFGSIDPTSSVAVIGSVTTPVQFICSAGLPYTITVNPSSGWQLSSGSNAMGYTPGVAINGTYAGVAVDVFTAGGSVITQGQYVNAPAGSYSNASSVTVTVSYSGGSITASLPVGSVTAAVQNSCSVSGSPSLNFGTLDAVTNSGGSAASVISSSIMCTMGASVTVTNDGGLNYAGTSRLIDSSSNYVNYNFTYNSPLTGAGGATDIGGSGAGHLGMSAAIPAGALDNAPAGIYTDTMTLTISY